MVLCLKQQMAQELGTRCPDLVWRTFGWVLEVLFSELLKEQVMLSSGVEVG